MSQKTVRIPGPDHPISISENRFRVVVRAGGRVIADSRRALTLEEAHYPPVHYVPRADVDMSQLVRTDHTTWCPYKGDCSYYSIAAGGAGSVNAVWTYETPHAAVERVASHLAFYPSRVDSIEELAA
jgi:uncharacterized protein (DUF427 family)